MLLIWQRPQNLHLLPVKLEGLLSPRNEQGRDTRVEYPDVLLTSLLMVFGQMKCSTGSDLAQVCQVFMLNDFYAERLCTTPGIAS